MSAEIEENVVKVVVVGVVVVVGDVLEEIIDLCLEPPGVKRSLMSLRSKGPLTSGQVL